MNPAPVPAKPEAALDELCINTLRFLSVDAVQKAACGRPVTAASPMRQARPATMRGTSVSAMTVRNGRSAARISSTNGTMAMRAAARRCSSSRASLGRVSAWTEIWCRTPARSVMMRSNSGRRPAGVDAEFAPKR